MDENLPASRGPSLPRAEPRRVAGRASAGLRRAGRAGPVGERRADAPSAGGRLGRRLLGTLLLVATVGLASCHGFLAAVLG